MNINHLKWIYEFSEHHSDHNYWESIFSQGETDTNQSFHSIKNNQAFPLCDLYVRNNMYLLEIELPGIEIDDLSIVTHKKSIELKGYYRTLHENCTYYLKERPNHHFQKWIDFPTIINKDEIEVNFRAGVMLITIPIPNKDL